MEFNVESSARHIHLCERDFLALFGEGAVLNKKRDLTLPNDFLSDKKLTILGAKRNIENVSVLGPNRAQTQVEIAQTDAFSLGFYDVPLRQSGDLKNSHSVSLLNPENGKQINLAEGLIIAQRHLHITRGDANALGLKDNEEISLQFGGARGAVLNNVVARLSAATVVHLDTDESNAIGGQKTTELVKIDIL
ncbi:MAG: propanediol utilization protein [Christensenellaceae bacterium]|jgi:putative phosphotransacetylase|nr:propanediol utilization protein [Christensenellaceae bacterium]